MRYLSSILFLLLATIAEAEPARMYGYPGAQAMQSPAEVVREGVTKVVEYLGDRGTANPARFMKFLEDEIAPYFDFASMTRWAAGPRFRDMTPEQRENMEHELSEMFLGAMAEKLAGHRDSQVQYLRPRRGRRPGEATVAVRSFQQGARPMLLEFRMYLGRSGWKVFDVSANGQSAVIYYRSYFARMQSAPPPAHP